MQSLVLWSRRMARWSRFLLVASYVFLAWSTFVGSPSPANAEDDDQETEAKPAASTEKDQEKPKEPEAPPPPAAHPPVGVSPYSAPPAYNPPLALPPTYSQPNYGQQPCAYPAYGAAPYGLPVAPPSYFGPSPLASQLQHPHGQFAERPFPSILNQLFQETRPCGQSGCPNCRAMNRSYGGTAIIADSPAPALKLRPGEAAQVILELIDRVGPSVLDGTLYAQGFCEGEASCMARPKSVTQGTPREALVQWIRKAEADRDRQRAEAEAVAETSVPAVPEPQFDMRQATLVDTLRTVGEQLDEAANLLERQNLFYRADQLRDTANQLRQESRSAQGGWSLQPLRSPSVERPPHPERDLKLEVEQLQQELRQALKALDRKNSEEGRR